MGFVLFGYDGVSFAKLCQVKHFVLRFVKSRSAMVSLAESGVLWSVESGYAELRFVALSQAFCVKLCFVSPSWVMFRRGEVCQAFYARFLYA